MSSHDARYEDSPTYDGEPGTTSTRTDADADATNLDSDRDPADRDSTDRDDTTVGGPVLLPVDTDGSDKSGSDRTEMTKNAADRPFFTGGTESSDLDSKTDPDSKTDLDSKTDPDSKDPDPAEASVGPDTETGALKDPVPAGAFGTDQASTPVAVAPVPPEPSVAPAPATSGATEGSTTVDWRELQGRFVDDPAAAVEEAGAVVEKALSELRARSEGGSTEDLRTAFRRYRDLHAGLS